VSIILGYDLTTLRERFDEAAAEERLAELGELRSRSALNEKVGLLRLLGRLDEALSVGNEAVRQARFTGDREELLRARVRRAQVYQFQGKLEPALVEFSDCVTEAHAHGWAAAEAFALQHRGKVHFDLEDYPAARADFREALTIRVQVKAPSEQIDSSMVAIAVAESFLEREGEANGEAPAEEPVDSADTVPRAPEAEQPAPTPSNEPAG
jgi:tetratricopeptide (TPR) repeat protein